MLAGAGGKSRAEFVGGGARKAARARRITELADRVRALDNDKTAAESELDASTAAVSAWESHLDDYPDDRALIAAHATARSAEVVAAAAATRADRLREEHLAANGHLLAEEGELRRDAGSAGLPEDAEGLRQGHRRAEDAREGARRLSETLRRRCVATVRDLAEALRDHDAGADELAAADRVARQRCEEYAREATALAGLTDAIGGQAERVAGELAALSAQRDAVRAELSSARESVTTLSNRAVKTETLMETALGEVAARRAAADAARREFGGMIATPGVWEAAFGEMSTPDDPMSAAELVRAAAEGRKAASEASVIAKLQALQGALAGSHHVIPERESNLLTVTVSGEDGAAPVASAARRVAGALAERRGYLSERYQSIFTTHLVRELADRLARQIAVAEDLCRRMNETLDGARSSQGVHVQLEWRPSPALDESTVEATALLRTPFADRTPQQDVRLREVFTERIDAEREGASGGYQDILARALDYRSWYTFTVRVRDRGPDGKARLRRLRQLSSGETRLISYVTLFAAAAAFYDAIAAAAARSGTGCAPLRLVLLDEAFERLDDPTIARMLELLVDLDMDWIITWPSGWGVSERIPRMHIYDVLRPASGHGIACTHTTWDGAGLARDDP